MREKILFVARNYPPNIGGLETLNRELYLQLRKKYPIELVKNTNHRYSIKFLISGLLKIIFSDCKVILLSDALLSLYIPFIKILRKKVLIRVNGFDITGPNFFYQSIIPFLTNFSDKIICISNATKNECVKRGISPEKCVVIPVGINPNEFVLKIPKKQLRLRLLNKLKIAEQDQKILLSVGRLVKRKGVAWFLNKVMPWLNSKYLYFISGDGPEKNKIQRIITQKKLQKKVLLLGITNFETLKLLYNSADIFVMPNINVKGNMEGFGIVALEAASCGLPVVASNIEGIKDAVLESKTGFLIEEKNAENFIKKIRELKLGRQKIIKTVIEQFSWNKIVLEYLDQFQKLSN